MKKRTNGFSASSTSYYESAGQYNFSGQVGFTIKKTGILLSGARYYFDGWRNSDKPFTVERSRVADSMRYMDWKPKEQFMGTIVLSRNIKQLQASFTSDYFFEEIMNRGFPRAPYQETAFDDYYKTKRFNNSFRLYGKAGKKHYVNLVSGLNNYTRIKNTYFKDLATLEQNLTENQGDQDTSRFNNITTRFSISSANDSSMLNYETGFDLGYETGTGLRIKNQKQSIGDYAVFASVEYRPSEKVVFKPALRVIYNTAYSAPLVPSFNIKYTVHGGHTLRASYARGFRSPSLKELYFYFVDVNHNITGNQELEAEHSHNFTLHYTFRHRRKKTEYAFELGGFYNHIENLITLSLGSGNSYSYFNLDLYKSTAVNTTISFNRKQFQASTGFSYIGQYNQLSETTATPVFVYSPETKFNLQYRLVKARCTFSLFYKYTGILPLFASDENGNVSQMKTGAYSMADFSVMKSFFGEFVKMTAGAKNLFNVTNVAGTTAGGTHAGGDLITPIGMGRIYFIKLDLNITR
ncbi:MAG TPA: TonB-dependent receptor [Flavobacteriales bacterium]|nr:TonB-dependent receptor [Flavobacteriales bacterium]